MLFTIPGPPKAKGRPRFTRQNRSYTPKDTATYENLVKLAYIEAGGTIIDGALSVQICALCPIPQSKPKKVKAAMLEGTVRPTTKPDIDNIIKAVLDGLNGVAFPDDKNIVMLKTSKAYSDNPRTIVEIQKWEASTDEN